MKKGPSLLKIVLIRTELSNNVKTTVDCKSLDERIEDLIIEKQTGMNPDWSDPFCC